VSERRLGRGLESLLGSLKEEAPHAPAVSGGVQRVPIGKIRANSQQPRTEFAERELLELAESIKAVGILQPLVVRPEGDGYQLIAGERRLRAAKLAGLEVVPIIERTATDEELLTLALIENLQREDLNPIEKAKGFKELIEKHQITQDVAAKRLGKDRSTMANFIRLLDLPEEVQQIVSRGTISMGHARALLVIPHPSTQHALALRIEEEGLSVREIERIAATYRAEDKKPRRKPMAAPKDPHIRDLEDRARQRLGTKVDIEHHDGKGRIIVHLFSDDDLQRVLDVLGISG
jgi:ParB family transcriptional regulator, chromosome partitioning protein